MKANARHGQLDEAAGAVLEELLAMARDMGVEVNPGEMMSRALRLYHAVVTGAVEILPGAELSAQMEQQRAGARH